MRRRLRSARGQGGFSIIELLIGFIFIGLLFGLFGTVVVSALRHGDEIDEGTTLQVEARAAVDTMAAELRQAYTGDDAVAPVEAIGGTTITFLSPDREQPFHLRRISYRLQSGVLQRAQAKSSDTDGYPWSIPSLGGWHSQVGSVVNSTVFTFYDSTGAVTATASAVETVAITVTVATKTSPNRKYTYKTSVSLRTPLEEA
jgi:Tfp pilus assembly protein PilW